MATRIISSSKVSPLGLLARTLHGKEFESARFCIFVDENTERHCLPKLISKVGALQEASFFEVPVGEECKQIEIASELWQALLEDGYDRNTVIVNLGGGALCDLGGFVAAGFRRGIRYINIPTTLLAMVDASIGGKTSVNLGNSKNQVGFFYPPAITCIDTDFLLSLPENHLRDGLFELRKTELLSGIATSNDSMVDLESIRQCANFKMDVCKADPNDRGIRKMLNFGHTFGHAVESFYLRQGHPVSHGTAVGIGMWCELYLSVMKLGLPEKVLSDYSTWLTDKIALPRFSLNDIEIMLHFMQQDKKNADGLILCVLLMEIGAPVVDVAINENEIRDAFLQLYLKNKR